MESDSRIGGPGAAAAAKSSTSAGGANRGHHGVGVGGQQQHQHAASSNRGAWSIRNDNRDAVGEAEKGEAGLSISRTPNISELPADDPSTTAARRNVNASSSVPALALPAAIARKVKRPSVAFKAPIPATFWNDKKSFEASRDMTFYREGTPPPSPPEMRYHSGGSSHTNHYGVGHGSGGTGGGSGAGGYNHDSVSGDSAYHATVTSGYSEPYDYKYDHIAPPAPIPERTILGLPRRKFYFIAGAVALVLILALAIGVGVGVGTRNSGGSSSTDADQSNSDESSGDSTSGDTTPTSTSPNDSPSSTQPAETDRPTSAPSAACPSANNTMYAVEGSEKVFLRLCGLDYSVNDGAEDVGVVWTANVQDCITNCAGFPGCIGAGWGVIEGDRGDNHRCWMKSAIGEPSPAREGWDFAILQDE